MFHCNFIIGGKSGHFGDLKSAKDLRDSIMNGDWLGSAKTAKECLEFYKKMNYDGSELMLVEIESEDEEIGRLITMLRHGDQYKDFSFVITNWIRIK